jgi:molybdopterin converting factor subunit 1
MSEKVRVLTFAGVREVVGSPHLDVDIWPGCTAGALLDAVLRASPGLLPHRPTLRLAVNGRYAAPGDAVTPGDEVAIIPPVAGG